MELFLIAEIGINHNGDIEIAKKLIKGAKDAGFDAVKFQKRTIDRVYTKAQLDAVRESPWGNTFRQQKAGLEFGEDQYKIIDDYCKKIGIKWTASCWDLASLDFIEKFNVSFHKIASPMLGHLPLLKRTAKLKKRTFISTGMSSIEEIDKAVRIFRDANCPFELMHCNSTYPMKEENANLNIIHTLKDRYKCPIGYSGHESSLLKVSIAAAALGATSFERHITLDRAMYGSDQAASIQVNSLPDFVESIRKIPFILGEDRKEIRAEEMDSRKKLRREFGDGSESDPLA